MKLKKLLLISTLCLISCTNESVLDDDINSAKGVYESVFIDLQMSIRKELSKNGFGPSTRSESDSVTIMGILERVPQNELEEYVYSPNSLNELNRIENAIDFSIDNFFKNYTAEDYLWLSQQHETYLMNGGHDLSLLSNLCDSKSVDLNNALQSICAFSDCLADKAYWEDLYAVNSDRHFCDGATELACRKAFRDKLALLCIGGGFSFSMELAGLVIPSVAELETIAVILDAGAAAIEYYACVKHSLT